MLSCYSAAQSRIDEIRSDEMRSDQYTGLNNVFFNILCYPTQRAKDAVKGANDAMKSALSGLKGDAQHRTL